MTNLLAAFYYCVGCSLVHVAMFITILIVKWPDVDEAKEVDNVYIEGLRKADPTFFSGAKGHESESFNVIELEARGMNFLMINLVIIHAYSFVVALNREWFSHNVQTFA